MREELKLERARQSCRPGRRRMLMLLVARKHN